MTDNIIDTLKFDENGLIPVITQDDKTNEVLMFAYMNKDSLKMSIEQKQAVYYSRSRQKLWHKGEKSGHIQHIKQIYADCDKDVILLKIKQTGDIACHTGRKSCFFNQLSDNNWIIVYDVIKNPHDIYKK